MNKLFLSVLLLPLLISACEAQPAPAPATEPAPPVISAATLSPSATFAPISTVIPTPSTTPSATPTPHPMSIPSLRAMSYPGSDVFIERELTPGLNYRRYYAYYYSEDLKIYALLTIPNGDMPEGGWPGIVFNHGYIPPDVYRTTERYVAYVDRLASSGYVVFRIDYRGHDQSEGQPTGAYGHPGYTIDVMNAVAALQRYDQVNPEKIGMWGHSMGGFLTLRAMVISGDVKAGVIWAGVVASYPDMLCCWRRTGNFTASPSSRGFGWRGGWMEQYGSRSPKRA